MKLFRCLSLSMLSVMAYKINAICGAIVNLVRAVTVEPEMVKLEAELEQAKQSNRKVSTSKPERPLFSSASARDFVTMLRGIGTSVTA